jgi:hypothetical protein
MTEALPVRPRVVDVASLQIPRTYEEGIATRLRLIEESQGIQAQLEERDRADDPEWRHRAREALRHKQAELRRLKEWLRTHDTSRQTEWALLGRVYRLLSSLSEAPTILPASEAWEEIEGVLDAIERRVPGRHLGEALKKEAT